MSIKQSIASLVILLSVSFSAFSASSGMQYYMFGDDCGRPTPPSGTTSGLLQNFLSTYGCVSSIYLPLKNGSIGGGRMCGTYEANGSNRTVCEDYRS
ncbi:hypothetical protein CGI20_26115, partial [Vibrio parahaemolyticus]